MSNEIKIADLTPAINKILNEYGDGVIDILQEEIEPLSKEIKKRLKAGSPKKTGRYAKGWRVKINKQRLNVSLVAYNATKPGLTHLLENGHAKVDGGTVDGIPHIEPVNEWAQNEYIERVTKRLEE